MQVPPEFLFHCLSVKDSGKVSLYPILSRPFVRACAGRVQVQPPLPKVLQKTPGEHSFGELFNWNAKLSCINLIHVELTSIPVGPWP